MAPGARTNKWESNLLHTTSANLSRPGRRALALIITVDARRLTDPRPRELPYAFHVAHPLGRGQAQSVAHEAVRDSYFFLHTAGLVTARSAPPIGEALLTFLLAADFRQDSPTTFSAGHQQVLHHQSGRTPAGTFERVEVVIKLQQLSLLARVQAPVQTHDQHRTATGHVLDTMCQPNLINPHGLVGFTAALPLALLPVVPSHSALEYGTRVRERLVDGGTALTILVVREEPDLNQVVDIIRPMGFLLCQCLGQRNHVL